MYCIGGGLGVLASMIKEKPTVVVTVGFSKTNKTS